MHLKLFLTLVSMLFLNESGGSGNRDGSGNGSGDGSNSGNGSGNGSNTNRQSGEGSGNSGSKGAGASETNKGGSNENHGSKGSSANQLIKAFAAERGVTVESVIDQFKQMEDKDKTELQRRSGERDGFKTKGEQAANELRAERAERAVLIAATKAKAVDPDAVLALAISKLEDDDNGKPNNVDSVIEVLRTERPERFRAAEATGDGGELDRSGDREVSPGSHRLRHAYETESKTAKKR